MHYDTFSSLNQHYDANEQHLLLVDILCQFGGAFFPPGADFQYALSVAVNAVPQQFDFTSDLMTQFVYDASDPIATVTLVGTVDDTDDDTANGTEVAFGMLGLPSEVRFGIITSERAIVNGSGAVDGADDGMLAGASFIDGRQVHHASDRAHPQIRSRRRRGDAVHPAPWRAAVAVADDVDPGGPPNPAAVGDDIAALMAEVADDTASVPRFFAPWVSGYVYRENGSDRRKNAVTSMGRHSGAVGMSAIGVMLNEPGFEDVWAGLFGHGTEVLRTTVARDWWKVEKGWGPTEELLPIGMAEHANENGVTAFAAKRSIDGDGGFPDADLERNQGWPGRSQTLSLSELPSDDVSGDHAGDHDRFEKHGQRLNELTQQKGFGQGGKSSGP